jgi:hypothetical protein
MHTFKTIRRLALGAAITGAAVGGIPAMASAASTCSMNAATRHMDIFDGSGTLPLHILNDSGFVTAKEGPNGAEISCGGLGNEARIGNIDSLSVFGPVSSNIDGLVVDLTGGPLPEQITTFTDANRRPSLKVIGNANENTMKVAGSGIIDLDGDNDVDVTAFAGPSFVTLNGMGGQDLLGGDGFLGIGSTTVPLFLNGGPGADQVIGGFAHDEFDGGSEGDVFHAIGGSNDTIFGGPGHDVANADRIDRFTDVVEERHIEGIGLLKLAPRVMNVQAGDPAMLKLAWKHPRSWRDLRKLKLSLYEGKQAVGMINVRPADGRLTSTGRVDLLASRCKVAHHGKWVSAKLWLSLPKSLAGKDLHVDVQATDTHGRKQTERAAGTIRVAK